MILRVASALMTVLFVVSSALQYNDPDPIGWAAIYAAAAVASGMAAARRLAWPFAALAGAIALAWAATMAPRVLSAGMLGDWTKTMGPGNNAEEAREFLGLCIVATWMAVLVLARHALGRAARR